MLGWRIEAARAQLHERTRACVARWGEGPDLTGAVRSLLDEVVRYTGAAGGELYLSANDSPAQRIATGSASVPQCPVLASGTLAVCPAWTTERGVVLQGAGPQWLLPPRPAREDVGLWYCAPIFNGKIVLGLIRLKHQSPGWLLPHGTLVLLREATTAVSEALRELNQRARARLALPVPPVKAIGDAEVHIRYGHRHGDLQCSHLQDGSRSGSPGCWRGVWLGRRAGRSGWLRDPTDHGLRVHRTLSPSATVCGTIQPRRDRTI